VYGRDYNAEYNANHNADYNAEYNADYNVEYNANYNTKYNCNLVRSYITENTTRYDLDSGSEIQSYSTMITIDQCKSTSESSPSSRCSLWSNISLVAGGVMTFKREGDDRMGISNNPNFNKLLPRKCWNEAP